MGENDENKTPGENNAGEEPKPGAGGETLADVLKKAGLSKDEIADTMREVLAELKATPSKTDVEAAEKAYFADFLK